MSQFKVFGDERDTVTRNAVLSTEDAPDSLPGLGAVAPASGSAYVWHEEHGWIVPYVDGDALWYYRPDLGWLWTTSSFYPAHYRQDTGSWTCYSPTKARLQAWYEYDAARWWYARGALADSLESRVPELIELMHTRLSETIAAARSLDNYPYKTSTNGNWIWGDADSWVSGYLPAQLLQVYALTSDEQFLTWAEDRLAALEHQKTEASHDMWFKTGLPFSLAYELTGKSEYRDVVITAAETYATLYNPVVKSIRCWSWGYYKENNRFSVVIDNLTDLKLFPNAARLEGGDPQWLDIAKATADTHARDNIREDFSTNHIVIYHEETGELLEFHKGQGWMPSSTWTRGQSWAILGYTQLYREMGESVYLELAQNILDNYIAQTGDNLVPPWDFDAPERFNGLPPDSSAAIIVARALHDLKQLAAEPAVRDYYEQLWREHLDVLTAEPYANLNGPGSALLLHASHYVTLGENAYDQGTAWGDYYWVEVVAAWARDLLAE